MSERARDERALCNIFIITTTCRSFFTNFYGIWPLLFMDSERASHDFNQRPVTRHNNTTQIVSRYQLIGWNYWVSPVTNVLSSRAQIIGCAHFTASYLSLWLSRLLVKWIFPLFNSHRTSSHTWFCDWESARTHINKDETTRHSQLSRVAYI